MKFVRNGTRRGGKRHLPLGSATLPCLAGDQTRKAATAVQNPANMFGAQAGRDLYPLAQLYPLARSLRALESLQRGVNKIGPAEAATGPVANLAGAAAGGRAILDTAGCFEHLSLDRIA